MSDSSHSLNYNLKNNNKKIRYNISTLWFIWYVAVEWANELDAKTDKKY